MSGIVEKFSYSQGAAYEADEFYVYQHPRERRKYVVHIDGGCSCYVYEPPTVQELEAETPLGKREVYAAFLKWWNAAFSSDTKLSVMESLRNSL